MSPGPMGLHQYPAKKKFGNEIFHQRRIISRRPMPRNWSRRIVILNRQRTALPGQMLLPLPPGLNQDRQDHLHLHLYRLCCREQQREHTIDESKAKTAETTAVGKTTATADQVFCGGVGRPSRGTLSSGRKQHHDRPAQSTTGSQLWLIHSVRLALIRNLAAIVLPGLYSNESHPGDAVFPVLDRAVPPPSDQKEKQCSPRPGMRVPPGIEEIRLNDDQCHRQLFM